MALEAILKHILNDANIEAEGIIRKATEEALRIIREGKIEAEKLYQDNIDKEKALCEKQRQKVIVNARLEAKKDLLLTKQELIDSVFKKVKANLNKAQLKKQQIGQDKVQEAYEDSDFYLNKIRPDYETKIAEMLFE